MGTDAHLILIEADKDLADLLVKRLEELEQSWSRFLPESELSRLNAGSGAPTVVSDETMMLIERAIWAWQVTGGLFDPTVLTAVISAGYTKSFEQLGNEHFARSTPAEVPGCAEIEINPSINLVQMPVGVGIDPGGIGKGLAADLLAVEAVEAGATGALVSLGGDLRVAGDPPEEGWEVALDHFQPREARVNLHGGALATSSTLRRRWSTDVGEAHHVIDPRTSLPSTGPAVSCSVIAAEAWWAEVLATSILVGWGETGFEENLADLFDQAGALVTLSSGDQLTRGAFAESFSL
ncbi:MAG: FAD:protein FMN transferase [Actinomycetes bacterium]